MSLFSWLFSWLFKKTEEIATPDEDDFGVERCPFYIGFGLDDEGSLSISINIPAENDEQDIAQMALLLSSIESGNFRGDIRKALQESVSSPEDMEIVKKIINKWMLLGNSGHKSQVCVRPTRAFYYDK